MTELFEDITTQEKLSAIWESKESGTFGTYESMGMAGVAIYLDDGQKFGIYESRHGWHLLSHVYGLESLGVTPEKAIENYFREFPE